MKKTFYPFGIRIVVFYVVMGLLFVGPAIYLIVEGIVHSNYNDFALAIFLMFFATLFLVKAFWQRVIFKDDEIYVPREILTDTQTYQHETNIKYSDIADIKLILTKKNSRGETYRSPSAPSFFYVFILKNDREERISVQEYNVSQRQKMLDIIYEKTGIRKNYREMYEEMDADLKAKWEARKAKRKEQREMRKSQRKK